MLMANYEMQPEATAKINARREVRGMWKQWYTGVKGLMTVMRVLPEELYERVMNSNSKIEPGEIFEAIVRGNYKQKT